MRTLITALLLCMGSSAFAQLNYVLNGDLENYSFCPYEYDQIKAANHWYSLDTMGNNSLLGIPEYCNVCADRLNIYALVPGNGRFFQYAKSGNGLAYIQAFFDESVSLPGPQYRDYLQGRLYKNLTAGRTYCVTFYVNLAEASKYAIKEIGAYLTQLAI